MRGPAVSWSLRYKESESGAQFFNRLPAGGFRGVAGAPDRFDPLRANSLWFPRR